MIALSFILLFMLVSLSYGEERRSKKFADPPKPTWPDKYHVKGTLYLPYAGIKEPFEAWYDGANKRSRCDFYGGVTKTVQRGDIGEYGKRYMVDPWSSETIRNELTCFTSNGTKRYPVKAQHMLPDLTDFKYMDMLSKGKPVNVYQLKVEIDSRLNTYTMHIDKVKQIPVYYKMHGYNNIVPSHYDEYVIEYTTNMANNYTSDVFDHPMHGMKCHGFYTPTHLERILANPMQEYIHPVDDSHVDHLHEEFVKKHNKNVGEDHEERKNIFKHNLRYIHSMNRRNLTYKMKVNHFADQSDDEVKHLSGLRVTPRNQRDDVGEEMVPDISPVNVSEEKNWRLYGAVTQVKDQAICGSCWSFGASGSIESAHFLKTGKLLRLSQQQQVDCSWGFGNSGCYGGEAWRSYKYVMKHGIATEEDYGQYLAINGYCHDDKVTNAVNVSGYVNIPSGDTTAMQLALFKHGPVAVCMDSGHRSFRFYSHGVYHEPACKTKLDDLDHLLLAVGYGTHAGEPYWLIKNSWSSHWGNDGYFLISRKDNHCGIATDSSYPLVK